MGKRTRSTGRTFRRCTPCRRCRSGRRRMTGSRTTRRTPGYPGDIRWRTRAPLPSTRIPACSPRTWSCSYRSAWGPRGRSRRRRPDWSNSAHIRTGTCTGRRRRCSRDPPRSREAACCSRCRRHRRCGCRRRTRNPPRTRAGRIRTRRIRRRVACCSARRRAAWHLDWNRRRPGSHPRMCSRRLARRHPRCGRPKRSRPGGSCIRSVQLPTRPATRPATARAKRRSFRAPVRTRCSGLPRLRRARHR